MKVTKSGIAKNISDALQDHEPPMTIKNLADKTGVGESKLKRILSGAIDENGNKRLPNTDDLLAIASALDVSPYWLLTGNSDENHVVCEELGLTNDAINTIKTLTNTKKEALEILLRHNDLLFHMYHYFKGDFARMTFNISSIDSEEISFESIDLSNYNGLSPDDLERLERLRLMDNLSITREKERNEQNETGKR